MARVCGELLLKKEEKMHATDQTVQAEKNRALTFTIKILNLSEDPDFRCLPQPVMSTVLRFVPVRCVA